MRISPLDISVFSAILFLSISSAFVMTIPKKALHTICDKVIPSEYSTNTLEWVLTTKLLLNEADPNQSEITVLRDNIDEWLNSNTELNSDVYLLTTLSAALSVWVEEIDRTDRILGFQRL